MLSKEVRQKIGALLKGERDRQKLSLDDLADQLKISASNLTCIEEGDHSGLPSELYFALFAKSYAEALKIDYARTLEAIDADIGPGFSGDDSKSADKTPGGDEGEDSDKIDTPEESADTGNLKKLGWMIAITIGIFAAYLGVNQFLLGDGEPAEIAEQPETVTPPPALAREAQNSDLVDYDWTTPEINPPEPLNLKLLASRNCWATIFTDGDTALRQTLVAGRPYEVSANYRLQMWVANPQVLEVVLNGQPLNLVEISGGRVNGLEINQANLGSFLSPPSDTSTTESATDESGIPSNGTTGESNLETESDGDTTRSGNTTNDDEQAQTSESERIPLGSSTPNGDSL